MKQSLKERSEERRNTSRRNGKYFPRRYKQRGSAGNFSQGDGGRETKLP
jgi:hypothetical protein